MRAAAFHLIDAGKLRVVVDRTYPLAEAAEAHRRSECGQVWRASSSW